MVELLRGSRGATRDALKKLGQYHTIHECYEEMIKQIKKDGFRSYYERWTYVADEDFLEIDYGSWTDFFYIYEVNVAPDKDEYCPKQTKR